MQNAAQDPSPQSKDTAFSHEAKNGAKPGVNLAEYMCLGGAYLMFRLPWLFMMPMVEAPDEFAHYWVIKFLSENMRLPNAKEVMDGGASAVYGSLPQLGYIPHVLFSLPFPAEHLALTDRLGSLFMGALMMLAAYNIGKLLFPRNRIAAIALPAAVILHPQLVFIHSYANCDSTSSALASIMLWLSFESVNKGLQTGRTLFIGALAGWVAISKYSGLAIFPVVACALISALFLHGTSIAVGLASFVGAALIALALSLWWFIQNSNQYAGDFSGTQTMYKTWAQTFHREMNYNLPLSHIIKDHRWWRMTFFSYWGLFGYMNKYLWRPVYYIYGAFSLISLAGGLITFGRNIKNQIKFTKPTANSTMWFCLSLCVIINITMMLVASTKNLGGPQGRYLITSEIPIMALMIGGLGLISDKQIKLLSRQIRISDLLILCFLAFNAVVTMGSWSHLFRMYGGWHLDPLHM